MMDLSTLAQHIRYSSELLAACLIFLFPLSKRRHWVARAALGAALWLFCASLFRPPTIPFVVTKFIVEFAFAVFFVFLCCNISPYDALYCASCAYATQHFASSLNTMLRALLPNAAPVWEAVLYLAAYGGVYLAFYFLFAKRLPAAGRYAVDLRRSAAAVLLILPFAMVISLVVDIYRLPGDSVVYLMCQIYAMLCCFFVLWVQTGIQRTVHMQSEMETQRRLWRKHKEQYDLSRQNIDLINRKCHDLKHQVAALRSLDSDAARDASLREIERSVMLYDSVVKTGNEALDTVLTEKSLLCQERQISWTCMADGSRLSFMDPVDLYTLFGNALDNAIESVSRLDTPEKRVIAVNLYTKGDLLMLQIENYYEGVLSFRDGLPATTKGDEDYHGYGMRSIRSTAEKYGGSITIHTEDSIFLLRILIPLPRQVTNEN